MYYVGVDLGGTNIAVGVVDENYNIIAKANTKTNSARHSDEIVEDIAKTVRTAVQNANLTLADIKYIGIGSPGSVNPHTGVIARANNLKFKDLHIRAMLEEKLNNIKVFTENDANAAAYGEMLAGAGRGTQSFIAVTLGTGVGGGVIIDGKMLVGHNYGGAELGHMVIKMGGEPCTCGRNGCFEAYASATALIRQTKRKMKECADSKMWELTDGDINKTSGRTAFDAMRAGDKAGKEVVDRYIEYIACGVTNIINIFQPEILCIGGGISNEKETLLAPMREYINREVYTAGLENQTQLKTAQLGNDAGIIGAAFLFKLYN